jgi:hypothetical protein
MAWFYAKLIEINVSINQLPVVVPAPSPTPAGRTGVIWEIEHYG